MSEQSDETQNRQSRQSGGNQGPQGGQPPAGQPPGGQPPGGNQPQDDQEEVRAAKLGLLVFAVIGLGGFIYQVLVELLGDEDATLISSAGDEELYFAVEGAVGLLLITSVLVVVTLAVYFHRSYEYRETPVKNTAIATAAGFTAVYVVLLILGLIFEPDFIDVSFGDEIPGFLGAVIGLVIVGAIAGYILDEDPLDILE